jgi:hypothetical protein
MRPGCGKPADNWDHPGSRGAASVQLRRLDQDAVAGGLDDAAPVLGDLGGDHFAAMGAQPRHGAGLVLAHQAAVAGDVGGEDRRQPPLDPLFAQRCSPWSRAAAVCVTA